MKIKGWLLVVSVCCVISTNALAANKYVKDVWNVTLYAEADKSSQSLGLLSSGTKLEVLVDVGKFTKVKTATGKIGWIRSNYLVSQPTSDLQLKAANRNLEQLRAEITQLKQNNATAAIENELKKAKSHNKNLHAEYTQQKEKIEALENQVAAIDKKPSSEREQIIRIISVGLICLIGGFLFGKRLTESKIRAKFNGMKVW